MEKTLDRFAIYLNTHPLMGIPFKTIMTLLFGIGLFAWEAYRFIPRFLSIVGTALIWWTVLAAVYMLLLTDASFKDLTLLLPFYFAAQGLKLYAFLWQRLPKRIKW